jgi:hypothetical protein
MAEKEDMIPIEEAAKYVEITSKRLGLLHLSFARTIVDEMGMEEGKKLILRAIKDYGTRIGESVRQDVIEQGLEPTPENYTAARTPDLPAFGMHEKMERVMEGNQMIARAYGCAMAKVWKEYDEEELGRLYCYVDPAKYMAYNPNFKLVHLKAEPDGDECCELTVKPTTEQEREDFLTKDKDWTYIDK